MQFVNNWIEPVVLAQGVESLALGLPDGEYTLTLADSQQSATRWEIVIAVVAAGTAALQRGQQGTDDQAWPSGSVIYCAATAGTLTEIMQRLADVEGVASGPLTIIDELASTGDLPASGAAGDAYLIAGNVWVWAVGTSQWFNAGAFEGPAGDDGRNPEFQSSATHVQWRLAGDTEWIDLLPLSEITGSTGDDGRAAEFQASATHLQYRLVGDVEWTNLVPLADLQGPAGREVELQTSATHVQWRYVGDAAWTDLVPLSELQGEPGDDGVPVELQTSATHIQWRLVGGGAWTDLVPLTDLQGPPGAAPWVELTQAAYDALGTPDPATLYIVVG
ncbi:MAG: hypothetical protein ABGX82_14665 [Pseudomonas sp.]|uniref:phage upper tail fiber protein n=1 Tax=Pseudomonas sp. TaxID=306 RepID=UPI003241E9A3